VKHANDFRMELDQRAISKGCTRLIGASFGREIGTYQGYSFRNGNTLHYMISNSAVRLQLRPQPHLAAIFALKEHAIQPNISASEFEGRLTQNLQFTWDSKRNLWVLQSESNRAMVRMLVKTPVAP
jgi:hypothetical protein